MHDIRPRLALELGVQEESGRRGGEERVGRAIIYVCTYVLRPN